MRRSGGFFRQGRHCRTGVLKDAIDIAEMSKAAKMSKAEGFGGHVLTGPIYVDGAEPGDMLEVRIRKVTPRVPYGVTMPAAAARRPE